MRRPRAAFAVVATVFLSLLATGFAGPAAAGGPTSVLLVVPGEGRTASLYTTDRDYATLATLVGAYSPPVGTTEPPLGADNDGAAGGEDASGAGVTLTWLMHDVQVWRVDRVFLDARGGPLISSQADLGGGDSIWTRPAVWHRSSDGPAIKVLLDKLGVGPVATVPAAGAAASTTTLGVTHLPTGPAGSAKAPATVRSVDDGWIWGPVGALLGAALTLVLSRRPLAGTATDPEADNVDVGTLDAETAPEAENPQPPQRPAETLSSHP
jgi:hypothetical protein